MFSLHELYRFSKTRLGQNLLGAVAFLSVIAACTALCLPVYNNARANARESNEGEANGRAIKEALGFGYTAFIDQIGYMYVDRGTGILFVKPDGPFAKAGLKQGGRLRLNLGNVKTLLIQRRGKTVILPVERSFCPWSGQGIRSMSR